MSENFDAIIIGAGQAGPAARGPPTPYGTKRGPDRAQAFRRHLVNNGCIPTKALVASAYAAHLARRAADYGVSSCAGPPVDMRAAKARKDAMMLPSRNGVAAGSKAWRAARSIRPGAIVPAPRAPRRRRKSDRGAVLDQRGRPRHRSPNARYRQASAYADQQQLPSSSLPRRGIWSSSAAATFGLDSRRCTGASAAGDGGGDGPAPDAREDEDVSAAVNEILDC